MEIVCDLDTATVLLVDPEDLARFSVRVSAPPDAGPGDGSRLADLLTDVGAARLSDSGDVMVSPDWLRLSVNGSVSPDWEAGFAAMCRYAASRGWIADDGAIQAHVDWPS
jgi:hypothetical protein